MTDQDDVPDFTAQVDAAMRAVRENFLSRDAI